ncbi:MAG: cytochrome c biogenesis protein ResB, partial [Magnetococcales bacterium]|nr:cytochrome c biogenesis protein ResB [Magnetococcales bacterium]
MEMSVKEQRSPGRRDGRFYSPWFAVVALLLVLLATLLAHKNPSGALPILVVPFGVAAFALLVLLGRREEGGPGRGGLAICHFSLLVMIILIGLGRMTYLQGWVEVPTGGWFDGPLMGEEKGPWHGGNLDHARFRNLGFVVDFGPDLRPLKTRNRVEWLDASGQSVILEIGEGHPLVLANFRFSTSSNKGYAPMFMWLPAQGGEAVMGGIHLPSFPLFDGQSNHWQIPDTELKILTLLQFDEPFPSP